MPEKYKPSEKEIQKAENTMKKLGIEERGRADQDAFEAGHQKGREELMAEMEQKFTADKELSKRKLIKFERIDRGEVLFSIEKKYDESGNEVKEIYKGMIGNQIHKYEYDGEGNRVKEIFEGKEGDIFQINEIGPYPIYCTHSLNVIS